MNAHRTIDAILRGIARLVDPIGTSKPIEFTKPKSSEEMIRDSWQKVGGYMRHAMREYEQSDEWKNRPRP